MTSYTEQQKKLFEKLEHELRISLNDYEKALIALAYTIGLSDGTSVVIKRVTKHMEKMGL